MNKQTEQQIEYNATRAAISAFTGTNEMTLERAVEIINQNHARVPLTPDDIFVFRMSLSNQAIDSYQTRMSESTLRNYNADFAQGRALMNSHRTGAFLEAPELPLGRTFATELSGTFLPKNAGYEARSDANLAVYSYIQRGLKLTDVSSDDSIRGIEGGTINDVSVGFSMDQGGKFACSICGGDMRSWDGDCRHVPGVMYEQGRAYAWVDNARGREASLVYAHSTPNAVIDKAIRMASAGYLPKKDALLLEEQYGVRITGTRTFAKPELKPVEGNMDWEQFIKEIRSLDSSLADRIQALDENQRATAITGALKSNRDQVEALKKQNADLTNRAALGDKWVADLVDQTVKARVRAEGDKFDAERYKKTLINSADPDYIREELASWERVAKGVFGDGKRQVDPNAANTDKTAKPRGTAANYRA